MKSCGVILSGGKSSRMGENKSLMLLHNKPVIAHIAKKLSLCNNEVMVVTNDSDAYTFLGLPLVGDRYLNKGPLAGLETALFHQDADVYMIAACDTPFIDQQVYTYLLDQLGKYDAVIPIYDNRLHPLSGVYKKSVLPAIQRQLDKNDLKVRGIFDHIQVNYVSDYGTIPGDVLTKHFFNMNNQAQYEQAKKYRLS